MHDMKYANVFDCMSLQVKNCAENYPKYVYKYLTRYIKELQSLNVPDEIISRVKAYTQNIYLCLIEYYSGQHNAARDFFTDAITHINCEDLYTTVKSNVFYRARTPKKKNCLVRILKNKKYLSDEMFHIPFEKRYLVTTQRYSYPGLPCLYLGESVEVCCEELNNWDKSLNIAIINNNKNNIYVLDLFFYENYDLNSLSNDEFIRLAQFWPLIASCSFTYTDTKEMHFRPDYIIPQLLLEYIIDQQAEEKLKGNDKAIIGIKYHTVKKPLLTNEVGSDISKYANYVFPSFTVHSEGYCSILKEVFYVKEVLLLKQLNKKCYENFNR